MRVVEDLDNYVDKNAILRKSQFLEKGLAAVITTVLKRTKSENLENVFDAVIMKIRVKSSVCIYCIF